MSVACLHFFLAFCACSAAEEGDKEGKEEKEEKAKSDSKSDKSEDKEDGVRVLFCWSKSAGTWNGTEVEERLKQLWVNLWTRILDWLVLGGILVRDKRY